MTETIAHPCAGDSGHEPGEEILEVSPPGEWRISDYDVRNVMAALLHDIRGHMIAGRRVAVQQAKLAGEAADIVCSINRLLAVPDQIAAAPPYVTVDMSRDYDS